MKVRLSLAGLLAATTLTTTASADDFAITGVTAWPMTSAEPVRNATIIVRNDIVASVESDGSVPAGMTVYAAPGAVVTPGLFNSATQVGLVELSSDGSTRDMTSNWDGVSAGFDISYALNGNSTVVSLARSDGMTGALIYPGPSKKVPFAGQAAVVKLRDGADILDHSLAALVTYIGGNRWRSQADSRAAQWEALFGLLDHTREARGKDRRDQGKRGLQGSGRDRGAGGHGHFRGGPDKLDFEAIDAVLDKEVPLVIFTDRESDLREAIALKQQFDVSVVIVGAVQGWRVARELAVADIPVVVTPSQDLPVSYDELGARLDNAAILARAGVKVTFGQAGGVISTNFNAGLALRQEAGIAVANGMPYYEALKAVTVTPRLVFGDGAQDNGTIATGKAATLVLWDGDPLEPSSLAQRVFIDGKAVSIENRQDLLARKYAGQ